MPRPLGAIARFSCPLYPLHKSSSNNFPTLGIPGLALDDAGEMTLRVDGALLVHISHDEAGGGLALNAEVHPNADALPASALRRALVTNATLMGHEGPVFSINSVSGSMMLEQYLPLQEAHYSYVEHTWITFLEQAEKARTKLRELAESHAPKPSEPAPESTDIVFLRA